MQRQQTRRSVLRGTQHAEKPHRSIGERCVLFVAAAGVGGGVSARFARSRAHTASNSCQRAGVLSQALLTAESPHRRVDKSCGIPLVAAGMGMHPGVSRSSLSLAQRPIALFSSAPCPSYFHTESRLRICSSRKLCHCRARGRGSSRGGGGSGLHARLPYSEAATTMGRGTLNGNGMSKGMGETHRRHRVRCAMHVEGRKTSTRPRSQRRGRPSARTAPTLLPSWTATRQQHALLASNTLSDLGILATAFDNLFRDLNGLTTPPSLLPAQTKA